MHTMLYGTVADNVTSHGTLTIHWLIGSYNTPKTQNVLKARFGLACLAMLEISFKLFIKLLLMVDVYNHLSILFSKMGQLKQPRCRHRSNIKDPKIELSDDYDET